MKLRTTLLSLVLATAPLAVRADTASINPRDVDTTRGPAAELYIRKRPAAPEAPVLSADLKALLTSTEKKRDDKRLEAIGMLRSFLDSNPVGEDRAEGMFKLAELLWEESRRLYLVAMDTYSRDVEKCAEVKQACEQPKEPRIDLKEAEGLYKELHDKYPTFRRMDLVTYLIGFAAKEDNREDEAMNKFQEVIDRFPKSPLYGDSWMMIGEHYFASGKWEEAKAAYKHIDDTAATADLALFKTAWCEWKLNNIDVAAKDFKLVLDKAIAAERTGTEAQRRRSANLRDEALEQLVIVFTEDKSISAKEVFDFLASIGGEQYSGDVLIKVAASYAAQNEWERSNGAYQFLVKMDPLSIKAAEYQRDIVENWNSAVELNRAQEETKILLDNYGPDSAWAKAQKNREALARSLDTTDQLVVTTAKTIHAEAQRRQKAARIKTPDACIAKTEMPADLLALYKRAADAYDTYLGAFGTGKGAKPGATELRYYRADILCFYVAQPEAAGDEYLTVAKTQPVGEFHKPALLHAMQAFELARPKPTGAKHEMYPVDKKFGEAIDLYLTLFHDDSKNLIGVLFKYGQLFYDNADYDEAIKRFGVIVTQYPDDPNAGPAGDRILSALNKAQDYENIETWARKLQKAKAFQDPAQQQRLSKLIVESISKSGDKYADAGKFDKAASFYLRVPTEANVPAKDAAQAMMNAGVMYEKGKDAEKAAGVYLDLAQKYATSSPETAEKAAFSAGQVYEKVIYYDRAAKAYELVVDKFGNNKNDARVADALFDAAVLRQALGQNKEAIQHYQDYAKKFSGRKDAADVAFNIGVVYEDAGDDAHAYAAFSDYAKLYRSSNKHVVEAWTRAGRTSYRLGQYKRAKEELETAQKLWKAASGATKAEGKTWAAEARYYEGELIFRDYEKVTLDVKPAQLNAALKAKSKLLNEAKTAYTSVLDYQDLKWATAALFRIGQVFEGFADALTQAANKPPPGLPPDQVSAYQDAINGYVVQIQDAAVDAYANAHQKANQMQVYDDYTAKIWEALGRMASDKFPPEHESRSKERVKDRAPDPEMLTEIAR
jgi:tetratricopeptide (TPR) repeat protein